MAFVVKSTDVRVEPNARFELPVMILEAEGRHSDQKIRLIAQLATPPLSRGVRCFTAAGGAANEGWPHPMGPFPPARWFEFSRPMLRR